MSPENRPRGLVPTGPSFHDFKNFGTLIFDEKQEPQMNTDKTDAKPEPRFDSKSSICFICVHLWFLFVQRFCAQDDIAS